MNETGNETKTCSVQVIDRGGRRYLLTEVATALVFGLASSTHRALKRDEELRNPVRGGSQERPDVIHCVCGPGGVFHDPPDHKGDRKPPKDCFQVHVVSLGATACLTCLESMLVRDARLAVGGV